MRYSYSGPVAYCKASEEQKEAATQNQAFTTSLQNMFKTQYAKSQDLQDSLGKQLQTLTNQGLAGKGYLNGEEANLRTDADEQAANANVNAQRAENQQIASRSDGGALTSGAVAQGVAQNATTQAAQDAAAQRGITAQNANLARQNYSQGLNGLNSLTGTETNQADSLAGAANTSSANSYNEISQAYQPSNLWGNLLGAATGAVLPGVGGLVSSAINGNQTGGGVSGLQSAQYNSSLGSAGLSPEDDLADDVYI